MAVYPTSAVGLSYITYPAGPTAAGLTVTAPGSTNTKGAYSEVVSSLGFTSNRVEINTQFTVAASRQLLIDLATGAAASEVVRVPDLLAEGSNTSTSFNDGQYVAPLAVASGVRVAVRYAINNLTSANLRLSVTLIAAGSQPGIQTFTAIGADTSDSGGTQVDPGGTANTKGAYSQIVASSAAIYQTLMLVLTLKGNTSVTSTDWAVDVATGAAASEVVLIPDLRFSTGGTVNMMSPRSSSCLTYIAASTRYAVRASCGINDATDRLVDAAIVVGTAPSESASGGGIRLAGHGGLAA